MAKRLRTDADMRALALGPVNVEVFEDKWASEFEEVQEGCRWLDRAARLYGRRRVERALRALDELPYEADGQAWVEYWRRWRVRDRRMVVPYGLLIEPYSAIDQLAPVLIFAPRVQRQEVAA